MKNSGIKWFEYLYCSLFVLLNTILGIVFNSSWLIIVYSIVVIISVFLLTKGNFVGNILQVIASIMYAIISFNSKYFGETITCLLINLPVYSISIVTWLKNRQSNSNTIKINKIKIKETIAISFASVAIFVLLYFMLKAFNTANLVVSTISMTLSVIATYLVMRRCEYNFVFYLLQNLISIVLWLPIVYANIAYLPTVVNFCIFAILNTTGIINWAKLKKNQKE